MEGDNLTDFQAALILNAMNSDPDVFLAAAQEEYEEAGYPDAETMVDELLTYLSDAAGEEEGEEGEDETAEDEADPEEGMA